MLKPAQWDDVRAREIIATHSMLDGAALPILHALQHEFGFVPEEAIPLVASALNLSRAEVHGIVTFYSDFRHKLPGRHVLKICRAEACQSMGGGALSREFLAQQEVDWGGTTRDGSLTIESVYCLGLCACSPSALYDGEPIGRLDRDKLHAIAQEARDR